VRQKGFRCVYLEETEINRNNPEIFTEPKSFPIPEECNDETGENGGNYMENVAVLALTSLHSNQEEDKLKKENVEKDKQNEEFYPSLIYLPEISATKIEFHRRFSAFQPINPIDAWSRVLTDPVEQLEITYSFVGTVFV
jgi:hypothetical protein